MSEPSALLAAHDSPHDASLTATRRLPRRQPTATLGGFRLTVVEGPDRGVAVAVPLDELCIGSSEACGLRLGDAAVSRQHCAVQRAGEGLLLQDLGSANGTYVDRVRIESAYLRPGAYVQIGETALVLESGDAAAAVAPEVEAAFGALLGTSLPMRRIYAVLPRLAASETTVLLQGETGTGKGLIAETLHQRSTRAGGPLVVVDCSAIPPTLIESELFGHEKGAFTGAHTARPGAFASALGGTIFLDEIGELPLDMQPKLLRALEDRVIKRIGSQEVVRLDVRVIAATNRDLRHEVARGAFRPDLFYRINVVHLALPPLRDRPEDLPVLITHFYRHFTGDAAAVVPPELLAWLSRQSWPGNVRELKSAVERAVLLGEAQLWGDACAQAIHEATRRSQRIFDPTVTFRDAKEQEIASWERWYVRELVRRAQGNLSRAAREVHMDRNYLRELLRRHGVTNSGADD